MFARCLESILGIVPSSGDIMITIEMLQILSYARRLQPLSRKDYLLCECQPSLGISIDEVLCRVLCKFHKSIKILIMLQEKA